MKALWTKRNMLLLGYYRKADLALGSLVIFRLLGRLKLCFPVVLFVGVQPLYPLLVVQLLLGLPPLLLFS